MTLDRHKLCKIIVHILQKCLHFALTMLAGNSLWCSDVNLQVTRNSNNSVNPFTYEKVTEFRSRAVEIGSLQVRRIVSAAVAQQIRDYNTIAVLKIIKWQ